MNESPKIAVVVPLFNKAQNIAATIESVLAQILKPCEIIVVDDGSSDGSADVVDGFIERGVTLVRQKNQGVSVARNVGVRTSTADYVAFIDADDLWGADHLEVLSRLITSCPNAGLYSTAYKIRRDGLIYIPKSKFSKGWFGFVPDFFKSYRDDLSLVCSSTACVNKKIFTDVGGFPVGVRRGEDIVVWIKLALKAPVAHVACITATYNRDGVNRGESIKEVDPSGALLYMADLLADRQVNKSLKRSIGALYDKVAIMAALGCQMSSNVVASLTIARLSLACLRARSFAVVLLITCVPPKILQYLQNFRHQKSKTCE